MVSVNSKTQTFTNGTPNDAAPVDAEFVSLFNNDAMLAGAVSDIENGNIKTASTLTINSAYTGGSPTNMAFMAERGTLPNTGFRWNEDESRWEVTHNGSDYYPIALAVSDDPTASEGMLWFNKTGHLLKYHDGTAVKTVANTDSAEAFPKGYIGNVAPLYVSASTIRVPSGFTCRDDSDSANIEVSADLDIVLSASGALGLDTGSEASNTWYYLWLIRKSSDATVSALFSASRTSPTLPGGYDQKRLLPFAARNNSSANLLPFMVGAGWPQRPKIVYIDAEIGFSAGTTATSFTSVSCATVVPPISRMADFFGNCIHNTSSGGTGNLYLRPGGTSGDGRLVARTRAPGGNETIQGYSVPDMVLSSTQTVEYKTESPGPTGAFSISAFTVTEVS
ncbi:MAG: hypothetical protein VKJ04_01620 [Vampirovibrionales bacterium]|nr:hypothetical protein [Vampirovibrionales bacterium]